MTTENKTSQTTEPAIAVEPVLATVGSIIKIGNRPYMVIDEEMKSGDLVWNEPSKAADRCIAVIGDDIVVEFASGMRACFLKKRFQKLVLQ